MKNFMLEAIKEARKGIEAGDGGPFGCVIVKDGKIIARAHNTVIKNHDATCHGEINAIKKASKKLGTHDLSGCELYTTSECCEMCAAASVWANIDKIYYGCTVKDASEIGFRDAQLPQTRQPSKQINYKECRGLFDSYKVKSNKKPY